MMEDRLNNAKTGTICSTIGLLALVVIAVLNDLTPTQTLLCVAVAFILSICLVTCGHAWNDELRNRHSREREPE